MADTDLVIGVEAVGVDQAVSALNSLAAAEKEVGAAASRMNSPLAKALQQRQALTSATARASVATAAQSSAFDSLTGATRQSTAVSRVLDRVRNSSIATTLKSAAANKKLGVRMAGVINEGSEAAFMFGSVLPDSMRSTIMNLTMAGNNARKFAMGLGVVGAAGAVVMALLPGLISWLSGTSDQMDDTAASTDNASRSLRDYIATARQVAQERAQINRIMAGGGTEEELAGMIGMAETAAEASRQRFDQAARAAGIESAADRARLERIVEGARRMQVRGENSAEFVRQSVDALVSTRERSTAASVTDMLASALVVQRDARTGQLIDDNAAEATGNLNNSMLNLLSTTRRVTAATEEHAEARRENLALQAEDIDVELMELRDPTSFGAATEATRRGGGGGGGGGAAAAATEEAERIAAEFLLAQQVAESIQQLREKRERFQAAEAARLVEAKDLEIEIQDAIIAKLEEREEREKALAAAAQERHAEQQDQLRQLGADYGDAFEGGIDSTIAAFERLNLALGKAGEDTIDTTDLMVETIKASWNDIMVTSAAGASEAFGAAIDAAVSGEKSFADAMRAQTHEFIRGIVQRSTVAAVEQAAMALAAAASYNFPAAAAHGAAAAQYAAVAGVAASVGVAAGTFAPKKERAEAVKEPARQREREERQQTMVINVGTFPVSTDADVGRAVQQALRAAERRDGGR